MAGDPPQDESQLEAYDRPEMPWERKADVQGSGSKMATAGLEFAMVVGLFFAGGWWLDQKLQTKPWLFIGLGMLGVAVGMWRLIARANRGT